MAAQDYAGAAARAAAGIALALAVAGPLPAPALAQGTAAVSMVEDSPEHYAFSPGAVTVPMGATVTWTDKSDAPHTVTADAGAFGSSKLNEDQTFRFTFNQAGTFAYHCSIHPYMHGTIVVTAAAQPAPPATAPTSTAQVPSQMPSTGAGGMAMTGGGISLAGLLAAAGGIVAALRRRR